MVFNDGVKVGPVAYIGLVSVLITFVLVLMLQVLYFRQHNEMVAAELAAEGPPPELADLTAKQQTALTQRGFVDRTRNLVAVGVNRGMELVLTDLAAGKPAAEVTGPKPAVAVSDSPQPDKSQGDTSPEKPKSTAEVLPAAGQQPTTDAAVESIKGPGKEREKNDDGKS